LEVDTRKSKRISKDHVVNREIKRNIREFGGYKRICLDRRNLVASAIGIRKIGIAIQKNRDNPARS